MTALAALAVQKYVALRRRLQDTQARRFTSTRTPELERAYEVFAQAAQSGAPRQPLKGWDLWRILELAAPKAIVELGSGTTSAVFALWAKRTAASYLAFEHDAHWAEVTENCLLRAGLADTRGTMVKHVASRVRDDHQATGFVEPIPVETDFIYVDGPPCRLPSGHKVANDDVTRLLDKGGLPRVIVVDGRVDTVDLIRAHPSAAQYRFLPGYVYSLRCDKWTDALAAREHTIFIRS